jgi:alpha-mannosidase
VAKDVPAVGYAVYRAEPKRGPGVAQPGPAAPQGPATIENEYCRVGLDPATGAMTSLVLKPDNWEALASSGNVVSRERDGGDLWELYQPLDGGSRIAMTRKQAVPARGKAVFSNEFSAGRGSVVAGPVFSEFSVAHPFSSGRFATRVRVYRGMNRVDIRTQLLNNEKFVRYQVLFPTTIGAGRNVHEIPFGAIERPAGIEFPVQNWADYGDRDHGLALLNRGLAGNLVSDGTMLLSLVRSTRIVAYGFGGGYEPGMGSDTGFELGRELAFDYALVPHAGPWSEAQIHRRGLEFNGPLVVHKTLPHAGSLPKEWSFAEIDRSHPNVVLSAVKPGAGGSVVLRIYEATGKASPAVKIALGAGLRSAEATNLLEDPGQRLNAADGTLEVDLRPFEIKTLKLDLKPAKER